MLTPVTHALRVLRRDPVFATVAICSLALGIGATSSMFTFAEALLLRPLPVLGPDRVVSINTTTSAPFTTNTTVSYPDYADLRDRNRTFEGLVAASFTKLGYSAAPHALPRMKLGLYVSGNFFRVLGVEPALGRGFRTDEDQAEGRDAVLVLGYDFWVSQFGASRSVLGSQVRLNGVDFTVIGVAPEHFTGIDPLFRPPLFIPLAMAPRLEPQNLLHNRDAGWLFVKGRLKPGVSLRQAQADIGAMAPELLKLHRQPDAAQRLVVETELQLRAAQWPQVSAMLTALGVLALCVLAIACANVAGLLLSRARGRSREIAVRLAIGAGRWALVRQLLFENLLVALAGGAAGILVADAFAGFCVRHAQVPTDLPIILDMAVDHRVLLFTLGVSVLSTLLFGLAPALRISRPDLVPALKASNADSAGKRRLWGRHTIVACQVALSMVLLVISSVLVKGFHDRLAQGPSFRIDRLFLASFDPRLARYSEDQAERFYEDLLERTRSAPGVRSAALTSLVPMTGSESLGIVPAGYSLRRGERSFPVLGSYVSEGYFETMDIPILRGRSLLESDGEHSPLVAVVNEHLANHYWPGGNALGQRFHMGDTTGELVEVVGIARMSKYVWIAESPADFVYLPIRQHPHPVLTLVAESSAPDAAAIAPALSAVVRGIDPDMPVFEARTMREIYARVAVWNAAMITDMVGGLGLTGLVLAVVGLYGLVAYSVSRRTREIGIRIAIGADRPKVVWMVLRQGLRLGVAGVAAGSLVAFFACRGITSAVGVGAAFKAGLVDYAVIALPLLLITALAALAPARCASRVDPIRALREE